jgi:hypothetical protein
VWESSTSTGASAVYAQRLDANGQRIGEPVTVFGGATMNGWQAGGVIGLADGSFLVAASGAFLVSGLPQLRLYVQRVSAAGELLASGGVSDAGVNNGFANRLLSAPQSETIGYNAGPFFLNADGSYVLAVTRSSYPVPQITHERLLVNVGASGDVGAVFNAGAYGFYPAPVVTRLGNGNFLVAGTSLITYAPVVWKILSPAGEVVKEQSLGAAPGNSTSDPQVTTLADGTGLLTYFRVDSVSAKRVGFRVDGSGNVLGNMSAPMMAGTVTGLSGGGYVFTWISGTQLLAQQFDASGQAVGAEIVVATNLAVTTGAADQTYTILAVAGGFVAVYQASTPTGQQIQERKVTLP